MILILNLKSNLKRTTHSYHLILQIKHNAKQNKNRLTVDHYLRDHTVAKPGFELKCLDPTSPDLSRVWTLDEWISRASALCLRTDCLPSLNTEARHL